jgi:hypothetical protein
MPAFPFANCTMIVIYLRVFYQVVCVKSTDRHKKNHYFQDQHSFIPVLSGVESVYTQPESQYATTR